jgi:hypothetical protein
MRTLTEHIVQGDAANHQLKITVADEPGPGGANHRYEITGFTVAPGSREVPPVRCMILFQKGAIKESGVNGLTQEALLAILADRLRSFQAGPYACEENQSALLFIENALTTLQARTRRRIAAGTEGTMKPDAPEPPKAPAAPASA